MLWDVFISHAGEDKISVARPLAAQLENFGLRVWLDETQLRVGDSLREKIDEGLAQSRFGVVVLSPAFFSKRWPQRELAGLFARGSAGTEVILPVWHNVSASDVAAASPMLADVVAVPTIWGIDQVAEAILRKAAPYLGPTKRQSPRAYATQIGFPSLAVERAVEILQSMTKPTTWRHLEITAPGYPEDGWMGCDSSTLIEVLYGFAAPLYAARALSYGACRNRALLGRSSRLKLALLNAALDTFLDEGPLASALPSISYSPRVPNWRAKRIAEPARYWWQGLSPDRFDDVRPIFLRPSESAAEWFELVPVAEFHENYRALYAAGCPDPKQQQALGLLGNGFFGFTPRNRPVLWRVLVCHSRLYQAALGNMKFDPDKDSPRDATAVFVPRDSEAFPFTSPSLRDTDLYEAFEVTMAATTAYLDTFIVPRLTSALAAIQET